MHYPHWWRKTQENSWKYENDIWGVCWGSRRTSECYGREPKLNIGLTILSTVLLGQLLHVLQSLLKIRPQFLFWNVHLQHQSCQYMLRTVLWTVKVYVDCHVSSLKIITFVMFVLRIFTGWSFYCLSWLLPSSIREDSLRAGLNLNPTSLHWKPFELGWDSDLL
jgi:hypothetical protein